jgi:hypothetical protein
MSFLTSFLAANWEALAAAIAAIAGAFGFYLKGRSDAASKAKLKDLTHANEIRRDGAAARASVDISPDRLRDDDGWQRIHEGPVRPVRGDRVGAGGHRRDHHSGEGA